MNYRIVYLLFVVAAFLLFIPAMRAQNKPAGVTAPAVAPAPKTPTLTDAQRVTILQAEVSVLTKQVENLQAQLSAKDKEFAFKAALTELYKVGETTAKDAGADNTNWDLDLNSLVFKEREKPKVTPAPTPAAK